MLPRHYGIGLLPSYSVSLPSARFFRQEECPSTSSIIRRGVVTDWFEESLSARLIPAQRPTGFPSPGAGQPQLEINLHSILVPRPVSSFLFRVVSSAMEPSFQAGTVVVVDRAIYLQPGWVIICAVEGRFLIRRYLTESNGQRWLVASNLSFAPILLSEEIEHLFCGVVTWSLTPHYRVP
jgi:SOS-response transcriptional repressor LexA